MTDTVFSGLYFISKSAYDFNQLTQRCNSSHCNKEDMMEVMICRKLHAVIRYK